MKHINKERVIIINQELEKQILSLRNKSGIWEGELSGSALSTAVSAFALWMYDKDKYKTEIEAAYKWLSENINDDGAWGDTIVNKSNMSTSLLCWAALSVVKNRPEFEETINKVENWLIKRLKSLSPQNISSAVLNHYETDKTFSVPILTMCALAGRLGENAWEFVPQLPFQFAALPDRFFRILNLSVVSYAIPALVAVGLVKYKKSGGNFIISTINNFVKPKVLRVLSEKQPSNGGFLEAAPLTGFVLMSLVGAGEKNYPVCSKAASFLKSSIRPDGCTPIDTNLSTWVTTLSVNSLSEKTLSSIDKNENEKIYNSLLNQQFKEIHPFTKSKPGGWAWTNLPGGAPDADDTAGAILALKKLSSGNQTGLHAASKGIEWLIDLQNNDGGFPTFCKGWGKLPFDKSCPDITAHTIRAILTWKSQIDKKLEKKINKSISKAVIYLKSIQHENGSCLPLWFGNEDDKKHQNPVYGTSLVLYGLIYAQKQGIKNLENIIKKASDFLVSSQNSDGGWGGSLGVISSIEETSLAVRALSASGNESPVNKGIVWIVNKIEENKTLNASPIGLYFASLWYYEKMYPLVFANSALNVFLKNFY